MLPLLLVLSVMGYLLYEVLADVARTIGHGLRSLVRPPRRAEVVLHEWR